MRPAKLKVTSPAGKARVYVLEGDQYTVGRVAPNHEPDIVLAPDPQGWISRCTASWTWSSASGGSPPTPGTARCCSAAVCAVAALTAGTVALTDHRRPAGHGAAPAEQADQTEQAERIAQRIAADREAELARQRERENARKAEAADALARALRAPGLRPVAHGDSVEVAFTEGLFAEGDRLTPTGAGQLAVLGDRMAGREARIEIHGHAAIVPGAPRSGGSVLALWRALVAARELSAASGKPLTAFTTTSADQQDAPYDSAARNRTVTVVITPV
jgi:hypothetical protein